MARTIRGIVFQSYLCLLVRLSAKYGQASGRSPGWSLYRRVYTVHCTHTHYHPDLPPPHPPRQSGADGHVRGRLAGAEDGPASRGGHPGQWWQWWPSDGCTAVHCTRPPQSPPVSVSRRDHLEMTRRPTSSSSSSSSSFCRGHQDF